MGGVKTRVALRMEIAVKKPRAVSRLNKSNLSSVFVLPYFSCFAGPLVFENLFRQADQST
jgi:hypothetical protein